jgi:hypothetical protein
MATERECDDNAQRCYRLSLDNADPIVGADYLDLAMFWLQAGRRISALNAPTDHSFGSIN